MCPFSGIFKGILGPKWENPGTVLTVAILNFWQKVKYIWDTGAKAFQFTKSY